MTADRVPSERNIIEASTYWSLSAALGTPAAASRFQVLRGRNEMRAPTSPLSPLILPPRHWDNRSDAAAALLCSLAVFESACWSVSRWKQPTWPAAPLQGLKDPEFRSGHIAQFNCSDITQATLKIMIHIYKIKF